MPRSRTTLPHSAICPLEESGEAPRARRRRIHPLALLQPLPRQRLGQRRGQRRMEAGQHRRRHAGRAEHAPKASAATPGKPASAKVGRSGSAGTASPRSAPAPAAGADLAAQPDAGGDGEVDLAARPRQSPAARRRDRALDQLEAASAAAAPPSSDAPGCRRRPCRRSAFRASPAPPWRPPPVLLQGRPSRRRQQHRRGGHQHHRGEVAPGIEAGLRVQRIDVAWLSKTRTRGSAPSGTARAAVAVPSAAGAPERFSTTTGTPRLACSEGTSSRAMVSTLPPGGKGAMMRTGPLGQCRRGHGRRRGSRRRRGSMAVHRDITGWGGGISPNSLSIFGRSAAS